MNILASIKIDEDHTITAAHQTAEYEGDIYVIWTTTDQNSYAALKLDPDDIEKFDPKLGLAEVPHFYRGVLSLKDVVVIPKEN